MDLPEFLSSVLDRTEEYISSNETNIKDLQVQFVVPDRTVSLLRYISYSILQNSSTVVKRKKCYYGNNLVLALKLCLK